MIAIWTMQFEEIITYQEKLGNYNKTPTNLARHIIITYQEKLGNYNVRNAAMNACQIITYQEKLGNYNKRCRII